MEHWIFHGVLVGFIIAQYITNQIAQQKLVNKLMSRTFAEYQEAKAIKPVPQKIKEVKLPIEDDPPEDLRALQGVHF